MEQPKMDWEDKIVLWAAPVVCIFLIVLFVFEA
jgi:cytochrome c-type biogenesis protein CcmH/NrfF